MYTDAHKQRVKTRLSHPVLKLLWATTHNPPRSLPGSPQTIKASINKPATHQLAHYSMATLETAPLILQYRLCEGKSLKGREQRETEGENGSLCPLCMSGLSLFQVIHRPQQRFTLELCECGMIIMKELNVSLCARGRDQCPDWTVQDAKIYCKWTHTICKHTGSTVYNHTSSSVRCTS